MSGEIALVWRTVDERVVMAVTVQWGDVLDDSAILTATRPLLDEVTKLVEGIKPEDVKAEAGDGGKGSFSAEAPRRNRRTTP